MTLSKKKNDISYINPTTGETDCMFNECRLKFKPAYDVNSISPQKHNKGMTYEFAEYFHECTDCGRRQRGNTDRGKSISSYQAAICGHSLSDLLDEAAGVTTGSVAKLTRVPPSLLTLKSPAARVGFTTKN